MTSEALNIISSAMKTLGFNYAFMEWNDEPGYPYFVGEFQEVEPQDESGQHDSSFILTGFTRGSWHDLIEAREAICNYFNKVSGKTVIADNGSAVAVFYSNSFVSPTGDAELKKIQINLDVKEWSVS
jgi:hypothetical protein